MRSLLALLLIAFLGTGCVALDYDLGEVPVPISAQPAAEGAGEPFELEARNVVWFYGLFGHDQPDVASMIAERAEGSRGIANFRIRQKSSMASWFVAHLTLTLVRMRTVEITGELIR